MGKFKDETGKTRVGTFLKEVAPTVLDLAGDITGVSALGKIGDLIDGNSEMTDDQKAIAKELLAQDIEDRKSAREMQTAALQQDDLFSKRFNYYLTSAIFVIMFVLLMMLFFVEIPDGNNEIVYMAIGTFIGIVSSVATFHFGSSSGSKEKSEGILKALQSRRR